MFVSGKITMILSRISMYAAQCFTFHKIFSRCGRRILSPRSFKMPHQSSYLCSVIYASEFRFGGHKSHTKYQLTLVDCCPALTFFLSLSFLIFAARFRAVVAHSSRNTRVNYRHTRHGRGQHCDLDRFVNPSDKESMRNVHCEDILRSFC